MLPLRLTVLLALLLVAIAFPAQAQRVTTEESIIIGGPERLRETERAACAEIGTATPESIPLLLEMLERRERGARIAAADALANLGPAAAIALPQLTRHVRSWPELPKLQEGDELMARSALLHALPRMGAAAVPLLREVVRGHFSYQPIEAARALGELGPAARDALPDLVERFRDCADVWEFALAQSIFQIESDPRRALEVLCERWRSKVGEVEAAEAEAMKQAAEEEEMGFHRSPCLHELGTFDGFSEITRLIVALDASAENGAVARRFVDSWLYWRFPESISRLPLAEQRRAIRELGVGVRFDPSGNGLLSDERAAAARILGRQSYEDPEARSLAWTALDDPEDEVRLAAAAALATAGFADRRILDLLVEGLPDDRDQEAENALSACGPLAVESLLARIRSQSPESSEAGELLKRMGPACHPALLAEVDRKEIPPETLLELLRDAGAARAEALGRLLRSDSRSARLAMDELDGLEPADRERFAPDVARWVSDEEVGADAIWSLHEMGAPGVPALCDAVRNGPDRIRMLAVDALGRIGPAAGPDAVAALQAGLADAQRRCGVAAAIAAIDPSAGEWEDALVAELAEEWPDLSAAETLAAHGSPEHRALAVASLRRAMDSVISGEANRRCLRSSATITSLPRSSWSVGPGFHSLFSRSSWASRHPRFSASSAVAWAGPAVLPMSDCIG